MDIKTATATPRVPVVESTNHPIETHLDNSLDDTSLSDYNMNDVMCENPNGFMDSIVLSDKEVIKDYRANANRNHSNTAKNTVTDSSNDPNYDDDAN